MNKIILGIIIGIVSLVIIGTTYGILINEKEINKSQNVIEPEKIPMIDTTQKSGPFQINKSQYRLGEKIFFIVDELQSNDKGQAVFIRPLNSTHSTPYKIIQFDGELKSSFNQMVEPKLLQSSGTCDKESLVGNWAVWFRGTDYSDITFQILDEIVDGETGFDKPVC